MARRRAKLRRARFRSSVAASMMFVCLFSLSPLGAAQAAPPGSFTISSLGCYPAITVDIRISLLATGGSKTNILRLGWSDGTTSESAPETVIAQNSYETSSQSDVYRVEWLTEPTSSSPPTPYSVAGTAILSWQWPNGNTKEVGTTTLTRTCN